MKDNITEEETLLQAGSEVPPGEGADRKAEDVDTKKRREKILFRWLSVVLVCMVISVASILVYDRYFATRIVAVDIKGFIAAQRDLFVQGKIDDAQLRENIESLERAIGNVPANEVVIMGDAVVRNARIVKP
jgi:hypothetical protein